MVSFLSFFILPGPIILLLNPGVLDTGTQSVMVNRSIQHSNNLNKYAEV